MAKKEVNKKETKKNNKNDKNKKTFFKSFKTELKKVVWLTPKQLLNNTVTVISIVIICAVIVYALDIVFGTLNTQGIERIRDAVVTTENTTTDNTADTTNTETNTTTENENSTGDETTTETTEATENTASEEADVTE